MKFNVAFLLLSAIVPSLNLEPLKWTIRRGVVANKYQKWSHAILSRSFSQIQRYSGNQRPGSNVPAADYNNMGPTRHTIYVKV